MSREVIRVAVIGAAGRMGSEVCRAISAQDDLELVAAIDPGAVGRSVHDVARVASELTFARDLDAITAAGAHVAVDFTHPDAVGDNLLWLLDHGVHAVVGTTGLSRDAMVEIERLADEGDANAVIAPNFAIGAVLLMEFAAKAAVHLPHVEIIELHHDGKADAPSGTALRTVELINAARSESPTPVMGEAIGGARGADVDGVRVHSIRLPGLVAHEEVIFGGQGQTLTLRHDSIDRTSFMPGVVLAVRSVGDRPGLTVGLEHLL